MDLSFTLHPSSFLLPAASSFPRGPGMYFSPVNLVLVLVVYLMWVKTCWWADEDVQSFEKLSRPKWNALLVSAGLGGLVALWAIPSFWLGFAILLLAYFGATLAYVRARNELSEAGEQVLTPRHIRKKLKEWFSLKERPSEDKPRGVPLRFIAKGSTGHVDESRARQAADSPDYQAALEMVHEAIQLRATDIHMEPTESDISVRYRVDGIMQASTPFGKAMGGAIINIFKILAGLDIAEKRKPQDGSFSAIYEGSREIDFRVATAGSVNGEKLVMRLLDRDSGILNLERTGMRPATVEKIREIVKQPHGLFIVCGPTGSGKSTTLYACLNEIDRYQKNVITIEDPVEYHIDNVTQIEINTKAGKTFASELRSILRQDPDVIYVGEIRDKETAEIACQAAQTGHMVFTTLHANDTVTALARLIDLGVQPFLVANAVSAVLGQRLVRVLCPNCKIKYKPNPELLKKANLPADQIKHFYKARERNENDGEEASDPSQICEHCGGTGYHGRTGVFELLVINDRMREILREANPNFNAVRQEAAKAGMKTMQEDGLRQVISGQTAVNELLRVCK